MQSSCEKLGVVAFVKATSAHPFNEIVIALKDRGWSVENTTVPDTSPTKTAWPDVALSSSLKSFTAILQQKGRWL